jgi:hypothetical protein
MSLLESTADVLGGDVGVDRRRLEARAAEELLDVAHVGAVQQEMRRAAVPERVGSHPHRDPGGLRVGADEDLDALHGKPRAARRQEEGLLVGVVDELGARVAEVGVEGGRGAAHDGDDAVLTGSWSLACEGTSHPAGCTCYGRGGGRRHEPAHALARAAGGVTAPVRRGTVGPPEALVKKARARGLAGGSSRHSRCRKSDPVCHGVSYDQFPLRFPARPQLSEFGI